MASGNRNENSNRVIETVASSRGALMMDFVAGEAGIIPGHALKFNETGQVVKNNNDGTFTNFGVVVADTINDGEAMSSKIYAAGDVVPVLFLGGNFIVQLVLAVSQTIAFGDKLTSAGNGEMKKSTGANAAYGIAMETITTNANKTSYIKVFPVSISK